MASNYVGSGELLTQTAPRAVASGDLVVVNTQLYGVALHAAASAASFVMRRGGEWVFPKVTGANGSALPGAIAYWYDTDKKVTISSSSNTKIGVFTANALSTATTAQVALNPNAL